MNVEFVRMCLHRKLRVRLTDGRIVEGTLDCYDNSGNMILACTTDVTSKLAPSRGRQQTYRMGTVMVPGHSVFKVLLYREAPTERGGDTREVLSRFQDL